MKTLQDLNNLIPTLIDLVNQDLTDSIYDDYADNTTLYEEDGWYIEINYHCVKEWDWETGDYFLPDSRELASRSGEVTDITAIHYNEETDETTEFAFNELTELREAVNEAINEI